jgi:CRP-like cAMP-binding protein
LTLLIEEYGEYYTSGDGEDGFKGYRLPWSLTHSQIGSAIGTTRVTVTRLMGKLRQQNLIYTQDDNFICIPVDPETHDQTLDLTEELGFEEE